jgi:hypothetical protein
VPEPLRVRFNAVRAHHEAAVRSRECRPTPRKRSSSRQHLLCCGALRLAGVGVWAGFSAVKQWWRPHPRERPAACRHYNNESVNAPGVVGTSEERGGKEEVEVVSGVWVVVPVKGHPLLVDLQYEQARA